MKILKTRFAAARETAIDRRVCAVFVHKTNKNANFASKQKLEIKIATIF